MPLEDAGIVDPIGVIKVAADDVSAVSVVFLLFFLFAKFYLTEYFFFNVDSFAKTPSPTLSDKGLRRILRTNQC
jgi:hypothetical protein